MMNYELMPSDLYDSLPVDPAHKFAAMEEIVRRNLYGIIENSQSSALDEILRRQYLSTISAAADTLGIKGLPVWEDGTFEDHFAKFQLTANGIVTKIRLNGMGVSLPDSVKIGFAARNAIEDQTKRLRLLIQNSQVPAKQQSTLLAKLDELEALLHDTRVSFSKVYRLLATMVFGAGAATVGTTALLSDLPGAIKTLTAIVHAIEDEKAREDAEAARLAPPSLALPNHSKAQPQPAWDRASDPFASDLDDDVPF